MATESNVVALLNMRQEYNRIKVVLQQYMDLSDPFLYDLLTLWVLSSWFYSSFEAFPYLYITGEYGSGKTTLGRIISYLTSEACLSEDISKASLVRLADEGHTIILDEAEQRTLRKKLNPLLGGYKKDGKTYLTIGGKVQGYNTYSPKAIINIKGMTKVLVDRCVIIHLPKSKKSVILLGREKKELLAIKDGIERCTQSFKANVEEYYESSELRSELESIDCSGREKELLAALLTVAHVIDSEMETRLLENSSEIFLNRAVEKGDEGSKERELAQKIIELRPGDYRPSELEKRFGDFSSRYIGRRLKEWGFQPKNLGRKGGRQWTITEQKQKDLTGKYGLRSPKRFALLERIKVPFGR